MALQRFGTVKLMDSKSFLWRNLTRAFVYYKNNGLCEYFHSSSFNPNRIQHVGFKSSSNDAGVFDLIGSLFKKKPKEGSSTNKCKGQKIPVKAQKTTCCPPPAKCPPPPCPPPPPPPCPPPPCPPPPPPCPPKPKCPPPPPCPPPKPKCPPPKPKCPPPPCPPPPCPPPPCPPPPCPPPKPKCPPPPCPPPKPKCPPPPCPPPPCPPPPCPPPPCPPPPCPPPKPKCPKKKSKGSKKKCTSVKDLQEIEITDSFYSGVLVACPTKNPLCPCPPKSSCSFPLKKKHKPSCHGPAQTCPVPGLCPLCPQSNYKCPLPLPKSTPCPRDRPGSCSRVAKVIGLLTIREKCTDSRTSVCSFAKKITEKLPEKAVSSSCPAETRSILSKCSDFAIGLPQAKKICPSKCPPTGCVPPKCPYFK